MVRGQSTALSCRLASTRANGSPTPIRPATAVSISSAHRSTSPRIVPSSQLVQAQVAEDAQVTHGPHLLGVDRPELLPRPGPDQVERLLGEVPLLGGGDVRQQHPHLAGRRQPQCDEELVGDVDQRDRAAALGRLLAQSRDAGVEVVEHRRRQQRAVPPPAVAVDRHREAVLRHTGLLANPVAGSWQTADRTGRAPPGRHGLSHASHRHPDA